MVRPAGLEPAAYGSEVRCSIQLSYGRKERVFIGVNGVDDGTRTRDPQGHNLVL